MDQETLSVTIREGKGRGKARRLRAQGLIPAVLYGKSGTRSLTVVEKDYLLLMRKIVGTSSFVSLETDKGEKITSVLQASQRNAVTDRFEHIDFREVAEGEAMTFRIPVRTHGDAFGVRTEKGTLELSHRILSVSCTPAQMPKFIDIDVTDLKNGEAIHIGDIPAIEGVTFQGKKDTVVVTITGGSSVEKQEERAAAAAAAAAQAAK